MGSNLRPSAAKATVLPTKPRRPKLNLLSLYSRAEFEKELKRIKTNIISQRKIPLSLNFFFEILILAHTLNSKTRVRKINFLKQNKYN